MEKKYNEEMLRKCKESAEDMERRILAGEVIADEMYDSNTRILVTKTDNGRYGYAVFQNGSDKPHYLVEGDYLIKDLKKKTDYRGYALRYEGAKSMIQRNMLGYFTEYIKDPGFEGVYINVQAGENTTIDVTQQMAGYNPQDPVVLLYASFAEKIFAYAGLAQLFLNPETSKVTARIGLGRAKDDGTQDYDHAIKMEMESQQNRAFFGERPKTRTEVKKVILDQSQLAQELFYEMFNSLNLPMLPGINKSRLMELGLSGAPIEGELGKLNLTAGIPTIEQKKRR